MNYSYLVISNRFIENATYFRNPEALENFLRLNVGRYGTLVFAFWSFIVPKWMLDTYKCYGLHTGPLLENKGRGGSPIDNLKALGVTITTLCAFEMNERIDGGRVVLAIPISLKQDKEYIIGWIDGMLPRIVEYITAVQPDIPAVFKRVQP